MEHKTAYLSADQGWAKARLVGMLGAATALVMITTDMYLPALPRIANALSIPPGQIQITLSVYFVGIALGQLIYGPISDRIGRRTPLLAGLTLYVGASFACIYASHLLDLSVFRFLQAIFGCAGMVVARTIIRDRFETTEMLQAFAWLTSVMAISPIVAPMIGSWLLLIADWKVIFIFQGCVGLLIAAAAYFWLPESRSAETAALAKSESPIRGYLAVLSLPKFRHYVVIAALSGAALFTWVANSSEIVINQFGFSPHVFGYVFGTNTLGLVLASQVNVRLVRRFGSERVLSAATLCTTIISGILLVTLLVVGLNPTIFFGLMFLIISSMPFTQANTQAGALSVDALRAGASSSVFGATGFIAGAIGAALASATYNATPVPVASVIFGSMATAWLVARRRPHR